MPVGIGPIFAHRLFAILWPKSRGLICIYHPDKYDKNCKPISLKKFLVFVIKALEDEPLPLFCSVQLSESLLAHRWLHRVIIYRVARASVMC